MRLRIDVNFLGTVLASFVIITCLVVQYYHTDFTPGLECAFSPTVWFLPLDNVTQFVLSAINASTTRVLIFASGTNVFPFLATLGAAAARVKVSVLMPQNETSNASLHSHSVTNVAAHAAATSADFVVIDNSAYVYSGVFADFSATRLTLLTKIEGCSGAVGDLASFFNFRFLNSTRRV
jgi:hypothetical protein